ncbi:MAG: sigma-54 dependent transcriptional regulator [Anaeromicrobium sp.]|jgi:DNA-binding NtrC family response regulator|uniref:sigma-54-dependent transcriptional regulator n=1 Tax=Anaeromicrobium sp. TaxID=1929132 RepID=UPI0025E49152|nr:sigma-54 dependent transcriptional regulator [Anaeromicrobium sp.]MCT4595805.1 sigma-54 dependent transcriptional regulator [Anaeromicrobium sp.]
MKNLLIIDDEKTICYSLKFVFEDEFNVYTATNIYEVNEQIENKEFHIILLDLKFGDISGLDLLDTLNLKQKKCEIIIMTAYGNIESSVKAIKKGAYDYIIKPLDIPKLKVLISKSLEKNRVEEFVEDGKYNILGTSKKMKEVFYIIDKIKDLDIGVLIEGSSGTGKELVAKAIHEYGGRKEKKIEIVNCGAIPENLIESELFGHKRGAFTGADRDKIGRFQLAHGSTLFLDEIGDMNLNLQVKLLRAIQQKEVYSLGGHECKKIDVRIISATNKELKREVNMGNFREDLYFRLNVVNIRLPDLKDRKEDIPILVNNFIKEASTNMNKEIEGIDEESYEVLMNYSYPGNIRELKNIIRRTVALTDNHVIKRQDLPSELCIKGKKNISRGIVPIKIGTNLSDVERKIILETLRNTGENRRKAAQILGISERTIRYKLKEYKNISN